MSTVAGWRWDHVTPPCLLSAAASIKVQSLDLPPGVLAALASSRYDFIGYQEVTTVVTSDDQ